MKDCVKDTALILSAKSFNENKNGYLKMDETQEFDLEIYLKTLSDVDYLEELFNIYGV